MQIPLGAIDNDTEDSLSAEIVTPPEPSHGSLGSIDQNTGNVTYTPAPGFSGNDSFTFKVMDNHQAESNIATVSITVKPVPTPVPTSPPPPSTPVPTSPPASENHPPQALNQEVTTESDKPVQIPLGAIDNDTEDSLSAEIVTPPEPSHGSLGSIDQNTGNVTYTPTPGFSGNDSFTFKVMDNHQAESNIATVSITVKPVPTPIQLIDSTPKNGSLDVLTNISDVVAQFDKSINPESVLISINDSKGKEIGIDINAQGSKIIISPKSTLDPGERYTVSIKPAKKEDAETVESGSFSFTTMVKPNNPPSIEQLSIIPGLPKGGDHVVLGVSNLDIKDENPQQLLLKWQQTSGEPHVNLTLSSDNRTASFVAPKVQQDTKLTFELTATDDQNQTSSKDISVSVQATPNLPPEITLSANTTELKSSQTEEIKASVNDENIQSVKLAWQQTSGEPHVNLTLSSDNRTASFVAPKVQQDTKLTFELTATDDQNQTSSKDISVSVQATPNLPPEITLSANTTELKSSQTEEIKASVNDENIQSVKLAWQQTSGEPHVNLTLSSDNRTASFVAPKVQQDTKLTFELTATDDQNQTSSKDISIIVKVPPINLKPKVSVGLNQNVSSGELVKLIGNVTDEGKTRLNWKQTMGPISDVNLENADQNEAYFISPPVRAPTKLAFNLTATDTANQSTSSRVEITVNPVSLENDIDSDRDGIFNNVDKDINKPSLEFIDKFAQKLPQTFGRLNLPAPIINPKYSVKDAANPQNGVVINVFANSPTVVNITACGSSSTNLGPGDIILLTCGSTDIKVIQGDAFTVLKTDDGSIIKGTLTEGNLIVFDPVKRTLQADSDNAGTVDLSVDKNKKINEIILGAGKTVSIPQSGNVPTGQTQKPSPVQPGQPSPPAAKPPPPAAKPPPPAAKPPPPAAKPPPPAAKPPPPANHHPQQ